MLIAQRLLPHVCQLDSTLARCIHEPIAAYWVELSRRYDLCELFHVRRLDIHYVKALILDIEIPQVYRQVVRADECFAVAVD